MKRRTPAAVLLLSVLAATALSGRAEAQWNTCGVGISTTPDDQNLPVVCPDAAGGAIIAWSDHRSATSFGTHRWLIYAQRVDATGLTQWAADGLPVAPDPVPVDSVANQQGAAILADGAGGAFIAWVDGRDYPYSDIYIQHINGSGVAQWAPTAGGVGACKAVNVQQNPVLASDGAGGVIVAWQDCRNGVNFDIYAQHLDASGAPQWTANGVAICTAADSQLRPEIIPDGAGGAILCWYDYRSITPTGGNADVYAQRVNALGVPQWTPDGVLLFGTLTGDQVLPNMISDGAGGAIIAWQDGRNAFGSTGGYDIFAQRVDGTGALLWNSDTGAPVCTAAQGQYSPVLCADGAGGAIVAWHDQRKGAFSDADVYAQHLTAAGSTTWALNGVAVCNAAGNQLYPSIVTDGAGGAILAWYDGRNPSPNLYTQRLNGAGVAQWAANGVQICGIPYGNYAHDATATGAGGAIVVWQDGRGSSTDIYAARVDPAGGLGAPSSLLGVDDPADGGLRLGPPRPNPTTRVMSVNFVLPGEGPATLDLVDIAGRLMERHEVGVMGAGAHHVELGRVGPLHAGLYFVRLTQGTHRITARATVIP